MSYVFNANGRASANVEHSCLDATVSCCVMLIIYIAHFNMYR